LSKVSTWEKKTALTGYDDSWSWAGYDFRRATQLQNGLPLATELGREELEYIASLGKWWEKRTASGSEGVPGPARKPKVEMLMEQLDETNVFFITHLEVSRPLIQRCESSNATLDPQGGLQGWLE
jgi:hypothetical protein